MTTTVDFYAHKTLGELYQIALTWTNGDENAARRLLMAYLAGREGFKPVT